MARLMSLAPALMSMTNRLPVLLICRHTGSTANVLMTEVAVAMAPLMALNWYMASLPVVVRWLVANRLLAAFKARVVVLVLNDRVLRSMRVCF